MLCAYLELQSTLSCLYILGFVYKPVFFCTLEVQAFSDKPIGHRLYKPFGGDKTTST